MSVVAIIGAAGVQGSQVGERLRNAGHDVRLVETGDGIQRLRDRGLEPTTLEDAGRVADAVILAVPDGAIKRVAASIEQALAPGTVVVALDAAAPFAAPICTREDLAVFVTHPCHPSLFSTALTADGKRDYNGGGVPQDIVCCLAAGAESAYATGERLARDMFAPVARSFRITLDQFILLEPTLSETTAATLLLTIREAMETAIELGVPADVARAFMEGHISVELAILFGEHDASFSISADYAMEQARDRLLAPDWKSVFEPERVRAVAEAIADGEVPAVRLT